jgi:hypothetical protein
MSDNIYLELELFLDPATIDADTGGCTPLHRRLCTFSPCGTYKIDNFQK